MSSTREAGCRRMGSQRVARCAQHTRRRATQAKRPSRERRITVGVRVIASGVNSRLERLPHAGRPGSTVRRMQPSAVKPAPTTCRRRLDVACVVGLPSRLRLSMACSIVSARASPGARRTARASADARRCGRKRIRLIPCDEKRESTFEQKAHPQRAWSDKTPEVELWRFVAVSPLWMRFRTKS